MSVLTDLLEGLAATIAGAGLGVTYNESAVYTASQTGVFMKIMPTDPDRVVVLNAVPQSDNITMPLGTVMVQVRGRGARNKPLDVDKLLDPIFDLLHGSKDLTFGSAHVIQMNRRVSVPMGMDELKRWERADQFYLDIDSPPTANRPAGGSW